MLLSRQKDVKSLTVIQKVEANKERFKIDEGEIASRRGFVQETKRKINAIKEDMQGPAAKGKMESDQENVRVCGTY